MSHAHIKPNAAKAGLPELLVNALGVIADHLIPDCDHDIAYLSLKGLAAALSTTVAIAQRLVLEIKVIDCFDIKVMSLRTLSLLLEQRYNHTIEVTANYTPGNINTYWLRPDHFLCSPSGGTPQQRRELLERVNGVVISQLRRHYRRPDPTPEPQPAPSAETTNSHLPATPPLVVDTPEAAIPCAGPGPTISARSQDQIPPPSLLISNGIALKPEQWPSGKYIECARSQFGYLAEEAIISYALDVPERFALAINCLRPQFFARLECRYIMAWLIHLTRRYGQVPTRDCLKDTLARQLMVTDSYEAILKLVDHRLTTREAHLLTVCLMDYMREYAPHDYLDPSKGYAL